MFFILYLATISRACHRASIVVFGKILYKNVFDLICGHHLACLPYCINCCVWKNSVHECSLFYIWPTYTVPAIESQLLCLEKILLNKVFLSYVAAISRACHRVSIVAFGKILYKNVLYLIYNICGH